MAGQYRAGPWNSTSCPSGSLAIQDAEACQVAAESLNKTYRSSFAGSTDWLPGCVVTKWGSSAYFNANSSSVNDNKTNIQAPICCDVMQEGHTCGWYFFYALQISCSLLLLPPLLRALQSMTTPYCHHAVGHLCRDALRQYFMRRQRNLHTHKVGFGFIYVHMRQWLQRRHDDRRGSELCGKAFMERVDQL